MANTNEQTTMPAAMTRGKTRVKNRRSQYVPSPMQESGRDSPEMFKLKTSKIESRLCALLGNGTIKTSGTRVAICDKQGIGC